MSRWFRMYDDAMSDPKVQKLSPHLFKAWFNLLCLANKAGNGVLPSVADIGYHLRLSDTDAQLVVDDLILAGLIDIQPDKTLVPHNWQARQAPSDNSKVRTKKWREGKKRPTQKNDVTAGDRHGDGDVTASDEKSDALDLDQTRQDSDNNLVPSLPVSPRETVREQGFKIDFGKAKGKAKVDPINTLTKRAEGLGLNVVEIEAETKRANPKNYSAYFTQICVNRLREKIPTLPEQMVRDALWGKSPAAYTAVTGAILMAEDARC